MEHESDFPSSFSSNTLVFDEIQSALDLTITAFTECRHVFQVFFLEGLHGKILTSSASHLQVNEDVIITLQPHINISYSKKCTSRSISPWHVMLRKRGGERGVVGFLMDVNFHGDKLDFFINTGEFIDGCSTENMIELSIKPDHKVLPVDAKYICHDSDRDTRIIARVLQLWATKR